MAGIAQFYYDGMARILRSHAMTVGQRIRRLGGAPRNSRVGMRYAGVSVTSDRLPGYLNLPKGMYLNVTSNRTPGYLSVPARMYLLIAPPQAGMVGNFAGIPSATRPGNPYGIAGIPTYLLTPSQRAQFGI